MQWRRKTESLFKSKRKGLIAKLNADGVKKYDIHWLLNKKERSGIKRLKVGILKLKGLRGDLRKKDGRSAWGTKTLTHAIKVYGDNKMERKIRMQ
jgi:hypothetical protein